MRPSPTLILATLALAASAQAQTVYRCGSSYSQQPCPGGTPVAASDARTPADAARAGGAAAADAKRAEAMEKARLAQEKNAPKAIIIGPQTPAVADAKPAKDGTRPKAGKLEQFTAVSPKPPGEAKKAKGKKKPKPTT
ncbi:MAG TPA: hypothetical protein VGD76_15330 [Ramlibacter sp.]